MKFFFYTFNNTALHIACENEDVDTVQYLIARQDLDINIKSISKNILIHIISPHF